MSGIPPIELSIANPDEVAPMVLAVLAHPGGNEAARIACHRALCNLSLRLRNVEDPEWANALRPIRPTYAFMEEEKVKRSLRTFPRRIRDRIYAAKIAGPLLEEARTGEMPRLPPNIARISINQLSEFVSADLGSADPENVEARIWLPTQPVIHLAVAYFLLMEMRAKQGRQILGPNLLLLSLRATQWLVMMAEALEDLVVKSPKLESAAKKLIRIRLI